jgi:hypothetical protein
MERGDWSFLSKHWQLKVQGGNYYLADDSKLAKKLKLPLRLFVYEDIERGEVVILSSSDGERYKGAALFDAPEMLVDDASLTEFRLSEEETDRWLFEELSPRRVVWDITLKPESDAWMDLLKVERTSLSAQDAQAGMPAPLMRMSSPPPEHTNDIWLSLNGAQLNVFAPQGVSNIEVYACNDLISNAWNVAVENLHPHPTNPATWNAGGGTVRFFRAGNMDIDTDSDALCDAREQFVHKTDETNADTDGDQMPDGWEIEHGLNPLLAADGAADMDGDGLNNASEYELGTEVNDQDSDGDTLPDGWEVLQGLNALDATGPNGATGDPDGDGLDNAGEQTTGTQANNPDTDEDEMPDGWEVTYDLNALDSSDADEDPDDDDIPNRSEYDLQTDPKELNNVLTPPLEEVALEYRSLSVSVPKFGWEDFDTNAPVRVFRTRTEQYEKHTHYYEGHASSSWGLEDIDISRQKQEIVDNSGVQTNHYQGSYYSYEQAVLDSGDPYGSQTETTTGTCQPDGSFSGTVTWDAGAAGSGSYPFSNLSISPPEANTVVSATEKSSGYIPTTEDYTSGGEETTLTLSNEYTTSELLTHAENLLSSQSMPDWSIGLSYSFAMTNWVTNTLNSSGLRDLSTNETSVSLGRTEYRYRFLGEVDKIYKFDSIQLFTLEGTTTSQVHKICEPVFVRATGAMQYFESAEFVLDPPQEDGAVSLGILSVELKEVSFSGTKYHAVKKDDSSGDYTAPHWQDNSSPLDGDADDAGDKKYPICFTRNTKMKVSAKWRIELSGLGITVKVKGDGPGNLDFPETTATISGNDLTITDVECSNPFVNEVDFFDPMSIAWSFSVDGGSTWCAAGTSANQTYVTLGDPLTTVFHTLAHLGCKNADGESSVAGTADGVYGEFTDRVVRRLLDNKQMTYWFNNQMGATETAGILQRLDANGNCQAWSALVRDSFKVQGISADRIRALPDSAYDWSILVKDWQINDPPSGSGGYPYIVGADAFDQNGVPGQGNSNPPGAFNGHWITLCNGCYYDGSYGAPKVSGADKDKDYEDGSLDGYGASLPPSTGTGVRKNDVSASSPSELDYQVDN